MKSEIEARLRRLEADDDGRFALTADESGWPRRIAWRGAEVARLVAGPDLLKPQAQPLASALLDSPARERLRRRLQAWLDGRVAAAMTPLERAAATAVDGPARGILFQLTETLGSLDRDAVEGQIEALGRAERKMLRRLGVRIGRRAVYMPELAKADAVAMRGLLWVIRNDPPTPPAPPDPARVSLPVDASAPLGFYRALGLFPYGRLAVRVDMVERIATLAWSLAEAGDFAATPELLSLAGCGADDMAAILKGLGYRQIKDSDGNVRYRRAGKAKAKFVGTRGRKRKAKPASDDSPFAKLRRLTAAR